MQNYARLGFFAILAIVGLRVGIGWHFFMEGAAKVKAGGFSSEGFLAGANGPLKKHFQALIWDRDGKLRLDQRKMNGLLDQGTKDAADHFEFSEEQNGELEKLRRAYFGLNEEGTRWVGKLNDVYAGAEEEIYKYWESTQRLADMESSQTWTEVSSLSGQRQKIIRDREADVNDAIGSVEAIWHQYEDEINAIATGDQLKYSGKFVIRRPNEGFITAELADKFIPIFDMAVGILLIVGLLTPLASWSAALFLISVVLSQMPGYEGSADTYFQAVEALACIVLATTDAGRYAGLDFLPWSWWQNKKVEEMAEAATKPA